MDFYIKNATLVNEGETFVASVFLSDGRIARILRNGENFDAGHATHIDARGKYLLPYPGRAGRAGGRRGGPRLHRGRPGCGIFVLP